MEIQVNINKITKEDLVNLLSTALYGSSYLSAEHDVAVEYDEESSEEEIMADILLHGGCIYITDYYAEGEKYREWAKLDEEENSIYPVFLIDICKGLERAVNGTFKAGENDEWTPDWREKNLSFARRSFYAFANDDSKWDFTTADCLMQIILFDEIIYG